MNKNYKPIKTKYNKITKPSNKLKQKKIIIQNIANN